MAYKATQFADCQTVIKTFERAAAYCPTEESVFAMLTPVLQNIRTNAGAFVTQSELEINLAQPTSAKNKARGKDTQSTDLGRNLDKASEDDGGIAQSINNKPNVDKARESVSTTRNNIEEGYLDSIETISDAFTFSALDDVVDDIEAATWYKDCIDCDLRPGTLDELMMNAGVNGSVMSFLDAFEAMFKNILEQYERMKQLFDQDPYADLCAFIKWMTTYVCIPDLARIIAALMALLSKMAFDFGGMIGLMLSLIAPLIQPFLTNLVNSLHKFLLLVIRPIECIINKLQMLISKSGEIITIASELQHSTIGKNIKSTQIPVTTRRDGVVTGSALGVDLHEEGSATQYIDASFGLKEHINIERAKQQQKVEDTQKELKRLEKASKTINVKDQAAIAKHNAKYRTAQDNHRQAIEERDFSKAQRINKRLSEFQQYGRSIISDFIKYLQKTVQGVEAYINTLWDELKKLMMEFGGGNSSFIVTLIEKMGIVQMIKLLHALIEKRGLAGCDNNVDDVLQDGGITNILNSAQSGLAIWTDDEGIVHIEDTNDGLSDAIDAVIEAFGADSNNPIKPGSDKAISGSNKGSLSPTEQGVIGDALGKRTVDGDLTKTIGDKLTSNIDSKSLNNLLSKAATIGSTGKPISALANTKNLVQTDKGNTATNAMQKLNSLIQLTGDPVLDATIARATEAVTSRTSITYKCPLQTSVANAEQVNKWIDELNQ